MHIFNYRQEFSLLEGEGKNIEGSKMLHLKEHLYLWKGSWFITSAFWLSSRPFSVSWLRLLHAVPLGQWANFSSGWRDLLSAAHFYLTAYMETQHLVFHASLEVSGRLVDRRHSKSPVQCSSVLYQFKVTIYFILNTMCQNIKYLKIFSWNIFFAIMWNNLEHFYNQIFIKIMKFPKVIVNEQCVKKCSWFISKIVAINRHLVGIKNHNLLTINGICGNYKNLTVSSNIEKNSSDCN